MMMMMMIICRQGTDRVKVKIYGLSAHSMLSVHWWITDVGLLLVFGAYSGTHCQGSCLFT